MWLDPRLTRSLITIHGHVQGIGFRPFIYRLAHHYRLAGHINNTCTGVAIDVQGPQKAVLEFEQAIIHQKPSRATITQFFVEKAPLKDVSSFQIISSDTTSDKALALLPDTALCSECLLELFDPDNRRHLYPFLHCISCGPRFSLFTQMPFDRRHTTMSDFQMCSACQKEYSNPDDKRFYSQTNCCPQCGPQIHLTNAKGQTIASKKEALTVAAQALQEGKIVALKNTGGYLLLVDATNEEAVNQLRMRKQRPNKPFALLMSDLTTVESYAHLSSLEKQVLTSPAAPIVLLKKKSHDLGFSVAHQSPYYGIMLPHNALQHLLLHQVKKPLVATSGNLSGEPLCITEKQAFETLSSIADLFLIHNRKIHHRLDDSIVHVMDKIPVVMRKARGYIPCAIDVKIESSTPLFAVGSHMKNSFAFLKQNHLYMSQHIGDLNSIQSCRAYDEEVSSWQALLGIEKIKTVSDKHPDYYLPPKNEPSFQVQHHQAHVWAAMADNNLSPPFLAVAWDGTGWGEEGSVWGGETFLVTSKGMNRIASLYPFALPGGEKAVREPRRSALGLLHALSGKEIPVCLQELFSEEELRILIVALEKKIHSPLCSSIGRLFDAVSALLGLCLVSDFEGQAALLLETIAHQAGTSRPIYEIPLVQQKDLFLLDWRPMIKRILEDRQHALPLSSIAMAFHEALSEVIVKLAQMAGEEVVVLTGGVMQNKLLVEKTLSLLRAARFKPSIHRDIPPNDGGIAVGQLIGALNDVSSTAR